MTAHRALSPAPAGPVWAAGALLLCAILAGCAGNPRAPQASAPSETVRSEGASVLHERTPAAAMRGDITLFALSLLDTPYARGGRGPATGFDCSGLVSHVFQQAAGLKVRGSAAQIGQMSRPIERAQLQPGDLVFFNTEGTRHSHVGVYVGDDRFVHASNPRTGVRIDRLSSRYYAQRFEGAQTLLD
jgi:cell wall-associated NlpC family hydrolase